MPRKWPSITAHSPPITSLKVSRRPLRIWSRSPRWLIQVSTHHHTPVEPITKSTVQWDLTQTDWKILIQHLFTFSTRPESSVHELEPWISKRDHSSRGLASLHLVLKFRINFKILLLTYKALNGLYPSYLQDLIVLCIPKRTLIPEWRFASSSNNP